MNSKEVYIIRGVPGSGKSTLARKLAAPENIFEADQYFYKDGEYKFDSTKLKDAHADCAARFIDAVHAERTPLVVSNTSTKVWEFERYIDVGRAHGYSVCVIRLESQFGNVHGVPDDKVKAMLDRMEDYKP